MSALSWSYPSGWWVGGLWGKGDYAAGNEPVALWHQAPLVRVIAPSVAPSVALTGVRGPRFTLSERIRPA